MLIDTHAHLTDPKLSKDIDKALEAAKDAGVSKIINVTCNLESIEKALDQDIKKSNNQEIYTTLGIHPSDLDDWNENTLIKFRNIIETRTDIVAIGEIGLDYYWEPFDAEKQKAVFIAQLELAKELDLPLIVHSRSAEQDTLECIKQVGIKRGVLHCYTGPANLMEDALSHGLHISFTGVVTYPKNEALRELVKKVPLDKLLLETDSPYLAPQSKRGQVNEPAFLAETAQVIADLKELSLEKLARVTTENAEKLFKLA